jgi:hypothetical protein
MSRIGTKCIIQKCVPWGIQNSNPAAGYFDFDAAEQWLIEHNDSMQVWHNLNALHCQPGGGGYPPGTQGYLTPGTVPLMLPLLKSLPV